MQQDAANKINFRTRKTMMVAQQLYEGLTLGAQGHQGLITYMRTDSTRISPMAQGVAADFIIDRFGAKYSKHSSKFLIKPELKMPMKQSVPLMSLIPLKQLRNI